MGAPYVWNYTGRNTDATGVDVGDITYFYSYQTCIAFRASGYGFVVRENDWGPTTGRHMYEAGAHDIKDRLPSGEFTKLLAKASSGKCIYARHLRINCKTTHSHCAEINKPKKSI